MRSNPRNPFVVLSALAAMLCVADGFAAALCTTHDCSNDSISQNPVYGDERLAWEGLSRWSEKTCPDITEPCTTDANRRCYEIALYPEMRVLLRRCESTKVQHAETWHYTPPAPSVSPYLAGPDDFPRIGLSMDYVVRACEGNVCSAWSPRREDGGQDFVEFVGGEYACLASENGRRCEKRCYPQAPKMFPAIEDCTDPY